MSRKEVEELNAKMVKTWNDHDIDACAALCSDDVVWTDLNNPEPYRGKEGVRNFMGGWVKAFPDFRIEVKNSVATDDSIAVEVTFQGTNTGSMKMSPQAPEIPATGKKVINSKGVYFATFRGGKAVDVRTYPDAAGMMIQLGLMPKS